MDSDEMIETMARAIYEENDPWHKVWPWADLQSDQASVDQYRRIARAALAAILPDLRDVAVKDVETWFPCGTIEQERYSSGEALRESIRARFDQIAKEIEG